ncbi:hypothetical protein BD410DRAFT_847059 [Rickenella mellea]|uniref:Uncharacterized protein n=1 Tax=Rickenella mellea TaxID=50990 RepID=A0A4Y7PEU6_9AGAM|nr:hypothetical protein BD410DRAFT_847059 [Rickenella mellea]
MGQVRANTSALRKEANFDDALSYLQAQPVSGWLAIVDSHSIIGAGGILTHERSSRNGRVTTNVGQRVSKVMNRWFGDDMMGLIRRPPGARHLRILVLCVCGPIFTVNQSLADLKSIVEGDYLDAIVGFSREVLTPQLVYQALSSFCIAAYTMCHFADTEPWMRVKRAVETGFAGQRTLFEHTPVIVISKGPDGVECTGFGYGSPNRMPWGIEPPACGHCGKHANIKANSKMGELVYEDSEKRSITLYMTKKAKYRCRNCNYRTPYLAMPSGIKLWRNPAVKNHFSYPYPTVFPDIKWTLPETKSASTPATPATSAAPLAHTGRRGQARTKHFKRKRSDEPITTMYDVGSDFDGDSDEDD